jgi:hypothetical protein
MGVHAAGFGPVATTSIAALASRTNDDLHASDGQRERIARENAAAMAAGVTSHPSISPNSRRRRPSSSDIAVQSIRAIRTATPSGAPIEQIFGHSSHLRAIINNPRKGAPALLCNL